MGDFKLIVGEKAQAVRASIPRPLLRLFHLRKNTCEERHISLALKSRFCRRFQAPQHSRPEDIEGVSAASSIGDLGQSVEAFGVSICDPAAFFSR